MHDDAFRGVCKLPFRRMRMSNRLACRDYRQALGMKQNMSTNTGVRFLFIRIHHTLTSAQLIWITESL
jgi:hypothetical protein